MPQLATVYKIELQPSDIDVLTAALGFFLDASDDGSQQLFASKRDVMRASEILDFLTSLRHPSSIDQGMSK